MTKEELWQERITEWQRSRETQRAFCQRHHLTLATFKYWRDKIIKKEQSRFAEVLTTKPTPFEVLLSNGTSIRVPTTFDPEALKTLVTTLS